MKGNITSLSGPGQGVPAVQDGTSLTITAASGSNSATLTTTIQRTNWFNRTTY